MKAGSSTEREMSGDSRHLYELRLEAGQLATVAVEQRGIDVAVEVLGRDGVAVIALNDEDRLHGEERLRILADATAAYTIAVSSSFPRAPAGMYRIRLAETRAAVDRDRVLYESHELRTEARRLVRENRPRDAVPVAERALALAEGVLAPDDVDVGRGMMVLGLAYENSIDTSAALRHFTRAFDILEARLGPDHPQTTVAQNRLATTYLEIGDYATAERLILDALGRQEVTNGAEHPIVGSTLRSQASLLEARGDFTGAERALLRARAIVAKWFGTDNEQFAMVENNLGVIHIGQRDYQRAQPYLERSLAIREKILGPEHPALASVVQNLGIIAREKRDYDRAARYYQRALAMRERSVFIDNAIFEF